MSNSNFINHSVLSNLKLTTKSCCGIAAPISKYYANSLALSTSYIPSQTPPNTTNSRILQHVLKLCNVCISSKGVADFCMACCIGKSHRLPSHPLTTVYFEPLELVFCELWGPTPVSSLGYTYYISFVDVFSRYTWIYFIKNKSEALPMFKQFRTMAKLQLNKKIKSLQSNWGGEFQPFKQYLNTLGNTHRLTCPYTHHQNGVLSETQTCS
ncbi:hypothetical protein CR513_29929, partial [Mucuna pruriens]